MKHKSFRLCILVSLLLALLTVQPASAIAGVWNATDSLSTARWYHSVTSLANGKVLAAGGYNSGNTSLKSAEVYDPAARSWSVTGSMAVARRFHSATLLLHTDNILVAGGVNTSTQTPVAAAELYNPTSGAWTSAGSMGTGRFHHTATLLANGKVLVSGGLGPGEGQLDTAELYDPATNTWSPTGSLSFARFGHTALLLLNGKVLVAGGTSSGVAELYDPATGQWTITGTMNVGRFDATLTLLPSGKALAVGGTANGAPGPLSSAELYDPITGIWTGAGSLVAGRVSHTTTLLPGGKVLVAGGFNPEPGQPLSSAELYDTVTGTWTTTSSLLTGRGAHGAVILTSGRVLAVGGKGASAVLGSAELYTATNLAGMRSASAQDGWALESSETSNLGGTVNATAPTFALGDNAGNKQFRAILSFNTSFLPDRAVVTSAILKIRKQGLTGTDPFSTHGKIIVDIRKGAFSNAAALQPADFQAAANKPAVGVFVNKPRAGGWYVTRLNAAAFPYIHKTGITQLRLRFQKDDDNDRLADFVRFFSGNSTAANRPVLIIEYYVP